MPGLVGALRRLAGRSFAGRRQHVLVTGSPRSGTSAMLEWLSTQPDVTAFFESRALLVGDGALARVERFQVTSQRLDEHLAGIRTLLHEMLGARTILTRGTVVHKEPLEPVAFPSADYDGFVRRCRIILPGLRILFMVRDPVATVWSMRQRTWGVSLASGIPQEWPLATCVEVWKENARLAKRLALDEEVRLCRFETLIADPEGESREIARHIGIRLTHPFAPRPTKEVGFSAEEVDQVVRATREERSWFGY